MKNIFLKIIILSVTLGLALSTNAATKGLTDKLIIKYKDEFNKKNKTIINKTQRLSSIVSVDMKHSRFMFNGNQIVEITEKLDKKNIKEIMSELEADPAIEYVLIDELMQLSATVNDTLYPEQWHYHDAIAGINVEDAWDISTGHGITVAVIDTGFTSHPDLVDNIVGGYDMIHNAFVGNDDDGRDSDASDPGNWREENECGEGKPTRDSNWHGTHVSGTIAAVTNNNMGVAGVAYDAQIVPVRVSGKCGGYMSDVVDGLVWAAGASVAETPTNQYPAQVINISLGFQGDCNPLFQDAINLARSLGSVVVVSAGNNNEKVSNQYPANCNGVITVAATNKTSNKASYSNYGGRIDIAAPGGESGSLNAVESTSNSGLTIPNSGNYSYKHGTSMATPHVSAVAALLYSIDSYLTPDEVESIIKETSRSFPNNSNCNKRKCGDGILDAAAAVTEASLGVTISLSRNSQSNKVIVKWLDAHGTKVDIYKNGSFWKNTKNDGRKSDKSVSLGSTYIYQVCQQGSTSRCSVQASLTL